jgi:hypothetical protein
MSNRKYNDSLITDEGTLMRRAWIDLALNSVRSQLKAETVGSGDIHATCYEAAEKAAEREPEPSRPHLYLAYPAPKS